MPKSCSGIARNGSTCRFTSSASSWASVNESHRLYKTLVRLHHRRQVKGHSVLDAEGSDGAELAYRGLPVLRAFHEMTGDLSQMYGLANLDAITRALGLPCPSRVPAARRVGPRAGAGARPDPSRVA